MAGVVGLTIRTVVEAPTASCEGPNFRTPASMVQPASLLAASMVQDRPASVGRGSLTVTAKAFATPVLVTSTSKAISSVALTSGSTGVFVIVTAGQLTMIDAEPVLFVRSEAGSLVEDAVALLGSSWQSSASVSPETFTVRTAPAARSPNEQLRTPPVIEQPWVWVVHTIPAGSVSVRVDGAGDARRRCW